MSSRRPEQEPPGGYVTVHGAGAGIPFAAAGVVLGLAGAWRILGLLPVTLSTLVTCPDMPTMLIGTLRTGLLASLAAGLVGVTLSEVGARRNMGQAQILAVIGSVIGIFAALVSGTLLVFTLLPDFQNCFTI